MPQNRSWQCDNGFSFDISFDYVRYTDKIWKIVTQLGDKQTVSAKI